MALTSFNTKGVAGGMADRNKWVYTVTTTGNSYAVVATVKVCELPIIYHSMAVTTNNLLFKIEYSVDGTNYFTLVDEFPGTAAATAYFNTVANANTIRISVKPAVAATHGTVVWTMTASGIFVPDEYRTAFAYESLTITNAAAVPLTRGTYVNATKALITVEDNPIRIRIDGTDPTTAVGHLLSAGDSITLEFTSDIYEFGAIATGGNAVLRVTYSR